MAVLPLQLDALAQHALPDDIYHQLQQTLSTEAFQDATQWLQQRIEAVQQFLPASVVRYHLEHPASTKAVGRLRKGTLLFADLSGFTQLSEQLARLGREGSEEITRIVNQLFAAMVSEIERYGGDLIKFNGDAITVVFDAEVLGAAHAQYALGAAAMLQRSMQDIGNVETRLGTFTIYLRIGIHSGEFFTAFVGDQQHREFIVVGNNVHVVAQAQQQAQPGDIVLSQQTLAHLPPQSVFLQQLDTSFLRLISHQPIEPPRLAPLQFAKDTNDVQELERLLSIYGALKPYLPANLTERQLIDANELATGGLRLAATLFAHITSLSTIINHYAGEPELIVPILNNYYVTMQQIVMHYGGVVNKFDLAPDGDRLMAVFGAPVAHENDAELALRAGLAMQEAINQINAELQLQDSGLPLIDQRIAINQGHVFAGLVGGVQRREYTVMGDSVNVAARLMNYTPPGDLLVGPLVRQHCSTGFEFEVVAPLDLKGKQEAIQPARVTRVYSVRRDIARAPLVGREAERQYVCEQAITAIQGAGGVYLVTGETGIGKTRLVEESLQWLTIHSFDTTYDIPVFLPITVECQFYEQQTPYASVSTLLRQLLRITPVTTHITLTQRLEQLVPQFTQLIPLLGDILSIEFEPTPVTRSLTPQQRHDRLIDLVEALLKASAAETPLLLIWDDIHWIDDSSQAMLKRLIPTVMDEPIFLVIVSRDLAEPTTWPDVIEHLQLQELNLEDRITLIEAMLKGDVPEPLLERWSKVEDTFFNPQGNPFFIEEMVRTLVDHHILIRINGHWELRGNLEALPSTIEGMITARLDQLEARYRETVQVAAVVGRRFQISILEQLLQQWDLPEHLQHITAADIVQPDQMTTELAYLFKHTMIRDVAYESILYARRRELHRRVAQEMEVLYKNQLEELYGILTHHYVHAEVWVKAFDYALLAGQKAQKSYANQEAIAAYETAVNLFSHLPNPAPTSQAEIYEQLGLVHMQASNHTQALEAFNQALETVEHTTPEIKVRLMRHMIVLYERRAEYDQAFELIEQVLDLALSLPQTTEAMRILIAGAALHQRQGNYRAAIEWAERALSYAKNGQTDDTHHAEAYLILGGSYRLLGESSKAIDFLQKSLDVYLVVKNMIRVSDTYVNFANTYTDIKQYSTAVDYFMKALEIQRLTNDRYGQAIVYTNLGDTYIKLQDYRNAIDVLHRSILIWKGLSHNLALALSYMNLGAAHMYLSQYTTAQAFLDTAQDLYDHVQVHSFMSELFRLYADLAYRQGHIQEAIQHGQTSLHFADSLEASLDKAVMLMLLGQIYGADKKIDQALEYIQQAQTIFAEYGSTSDVEMCEQLIQHLTS